MYWRAQALLKHQERRVTVKLHCMLIALEYKTHGLMFSISEFLTLTDLSPGSTRLTFDILGDIEVFSFY